MRPVAIKGQRAPMVTMHLPREATPEQIRALIQNCGRGQVDDLGRPTREGWEDFQFQRATAEWAFLSFYFPERFGSVMATGINVSLRMPNGGQSSTGRRIEIPERLRGSRKWAHVFANYAHVRHTDQVAMTWFLDKARCPVSLLEPDFAFADIDTTVYPSLDVDPWERAWPLMIFGPERVKKIGRDVLLDAPAWKVEELPYGGIWVQAWENPFDVPQKMVTTLADYLGLPPREP